MSARRLILNFLMALVVAAPLAIMEGRPVPEFPVVSVPVILKSTPSLIPSIRLKKLTGPDLIELTSQKALRSLPPLESLRVYDSLIKRVATDFRISPALVKAIIRAESNFNPQAVSAMGAVGLMQIRPEAVKQVGLVLTTDPKANIVAGVKYLKYLLDMFEDDETLAVAAYNSGPTSVLKFGGVPPFEETRQFVSRVMLYYHSYLDS
ncbi:MAG: lytic transglycosylase domain-containing protein [Deltaproteobacteria bacterium]|nr:lytic transglycosylase domain-containing protein [Deltaproteobacteria bacterium]